jgi:hypothetical protein
MASPGVLFALTVNALALRHRGEAHPSGNAGFAKKAGPCACARPRLAMSGTFFLNGVRHACVSVLRNN